MIWFLLSVAILSAEPESLGQRTLFDAGQTADSQWQSGLSVQSHADKGVLTVALLAGQSGWSAYDGRWIFDPHALLVIEPTDLRGRLTVQIEWFAALDRFIEATTVVRDLAEPTGPITAALIDLLPEAFKADIADKPRSCRVKIWLEGASASVTFKTLRLTSPRRWRQPGVRLVHACLPTDAALKPDDGLTVHRHDQWFSMRLSDRQTFAGLLLDDEVAFDPAGVVLLDLARVSNGSVGLQAVCFDADGNYLQSVDLLKGLGSEGLFEQDFAGHRTALPEGVSRVRFKLWLAGHHAEAQVAGLFYGVAGP